MTVDARGPVAVANGRDLPAAARAHHLYWPRFSTAIRNGALET
jgi:hypothetical protein